MRVHFMGIGGSGMSAIAQIAAHQGFKVSGCDLQEDTPYLEKVRKAHITIQSGHDLSHLKDIDILAVTPAVFFQSAKHPELVEGQNKEIVMTWQEFLGTYLHEDKFVICIAGTHGKSTTTTMAGLLLEQAGLDPTVEVGATIPTWNNNMRIGNSSYFVSEADEYYHNFLHYHPDIIILNNIEMDHPEYFHTIDNLLKAFQDFVNNLKPNGVLIYNTDSPLIHKLQLPKSSIPYSLSDFPSDLKLGVPGNHNKSNALGIIKLAGILKIDSKLVYSTISTFTGIGRRIELLGEKGGIKVYDDYANHPTAFTASIATIKELNPTSRIWAIIEPHTFSRLRAVLADLPESLKQADHIIITKIYASREQDPGDFTGADIAKVCGGEYIPEFTDIVNKVTIQAKPNDVILIMGSGDSYKLSRQIIETIGN